MSRPADQLPLEDYRTALDESAIVAMTDASGRISYVNDRFCEIAGYGREELIGKTHRVVNSRFHDAAFFRGLWSTIAAGRIWRGRIRNQAKDGRHYWVDTTITPFVGSDGRPDRYLAVRHDVTPLVTAMEQLGESEARFRALFENAGAGIALVDPSDRIVEASPAFCRLVGYPEAEVRGRAFTDFRHPEDDAVDKVLFGELMAGARDSYDVLKRYVRKDQTTFWGQTIVSAVRADGDDPPHIIGIVRDVTEVIRAEEKLREQAALARLGEMAAVVAHEVKNPLAGILGAVEMIGKRLETNAPERDVITTISQRIAALNALVEDLLVFARPREPRLTDVGVRGVLERVRAGLLRDPSYTGVSVEILGEDVSVSADPDQLERAFLNLALNAAQAMGGAGEVRVELLTTDDRAQIAVLDRGPGIPLDLRAKVSEPFFTTKARGAGLGLATAKRVIEALDGTIRFGEREGGGARVEISLPRCPPA